MEYWQSYYRNSDDPYPIYDHWLDSALPEILAAQTVVDLGCGNGVDSLFLAEQGASPIGCDISREALDALAARAPGVRTLCFDMTKGLPFADGAVDVLIADLSLHFFPWETTRAIADEILRALRPGGLLLCRVNALEDFRQREGDVEVEPHFYRTGGRDTRFFDEAALRMLLQRFALEKIEHGVTEKYPKCGPKHFWMVAARRAERGGRA